MITKAAQRILDELTTRNTTIVIARERCFYSDTLQTVPRRVVEALQDADKLAFSHRHNNVSKAYKAVA